MGPQSAIIYSKVVETFLCSTQHTKQKIQKEKKRKKAEKHLKDLVLANKMTDLLNGVVAS